MGTAVVYGLELLFGRKGFVLHNLPLLALGFPPSLRHAIFRSGEAPLAGAVVATAAWTWIAYAVFSNNQGGVCLSVRWLVPLLAPLFYLLCVASRDNADVIAPLAALTAIAIPMGVLMWWRGPWAPRMVPFYWGWVAAAIVLGIAARRAAGQGRLKS